jgi:O-antigen/teichoic acid export membrane protein
MWVSLVAAAVGVGANFLLIGWWGVTGAAAATLAAAMTFIVLWFAVSQQLYHVPVRWLPVALVTAAATAAGIIGLLAPYASLSVGILTKTGLVAATLLLIFVTDLLQWRPIFHWLKTPRTALAQRARKQ